MLCNGFFAIASSQSFINSTRCSKAHFRRDFRITQRFYLWQRLCFLEQGIYTYPQLRDRHSFTVHCFLPALTKALFRQY